MEKANLDPNFRGFLESLNSAGVRYLVLGGYAVNHYGHHRSTNDLDVWIATDLANARRVSQVMREYVGFPAADVPPSMFQDKGRIFMFGRVPVRIDLLTDPSGVEFEECFARRVIANWDGVDVSLISFNDLKRNKQESGRPKDLSDLQNLPPKFEHAPKETKDRSKRKRKDV